MDFPKLSAYQYKKALRVHKILPGFYPSVYTAFAVRFLSDQTDFASRNPRKLFPIHFPKETITILYHIYIVVV